MIQKTQEVKNTWSPALLHAFYGEESNIQAPAREISVELKEKQVRETMKLNAWQGNIARVSF